MGEVSEGDRPRCAIRMDLDGWSRNSGSNSAPVSAVVRAHDNSSIVFKHSELSSIRHPWRSLHLSQATYNMIEQGGRIELFDKHIMAYLVVQVQRIDLASLKSKAMLEGDK